MRSKDFLIENTRSSLESLTAPEIADIIIRDCLPYVQELKKIKFHNMLFRGIHAEFFGLSRHWCPSNRTPRDTHHMIHKAADDWFFKKFGIRYRSNAVFTSPSEQAINDAEYGEIYGFFPIGNFSYVWSPITRDFTFDEGDIENLTHRIKLPTYHKDYKGKEMSQETVNEEVARIMDRKAYKDTDLHTAIGAYGNEVAVHCTDYYLVSNYDIEGMPNLYSDVLLGIRKKMS